MEDALYVQSGFCANQAAIAPLVGRDRETGQQDVIFSDRLNHASIIDGARLSGAKIVVYEHCDAADAERVIAREPAAATAAGLLVTDGVFSMDGDIAPLDGLYEVAERYGVMTMVDDAHGEGVLGGGRGIVHHFGLQGKFDVEIGTLSKAFGVVGGVIAGTKQVVDYLRQKARPVPVFQRRHAGRHGGLPGGGGHAGARRASWWSACGPTPPIFKRGPADARALTPATARRPSSR